MRSILRRRELLVDDWKYSREVGAPNLANPLEAALIVTLLELRADPDLWHGRPGRLGVRLSPVDNVEELTPHLRRLELVAVEFPGPGDGRGFSQARLLRTRLGFRGELRAIGAGVRQDLIFLMVRCGFDSFELAPGQTVDSALRAYERYTVAYQPGAALESITRQRFGAD
ncbi:MAG TPA: DUF934 domain-containing protein [Steroidobacteraceae bacterium]|nr:DUF934 domain-containing protein [Steroidobacteraceae bacterium]